MLMIRAIVRPEKVNVVMQTLLAAGFPSVSKMDILGRGKQRGITIGEAHYDEIPKKMLMMVVNDEDKEEVIDIIMNTARSGEKGTFGDGKIFVSPITEAYTISSGKKQL